MAGHEIVPLFFFERSVRIFNSVVTVEELFRRKIDSPMCPEIIWVDLSSTVDPRKPKHVPRVITGRWKKLVRHLIEVVVHELVHDRFTKFVEMCVNPVLVFNLLTA